ncbi:hypothetical protein EWM64_g234 [Hericium alpestre]|uniref:FAM192A/Fyv6 N-terminal domain-containing protein n=1 Tax=Hericium alpestre TaxID=135208 RepID=A0A4Z0AAJ4_9AGAM|nr:hypothetical protein EWM64_g234 [Hericium alpestre]
MAEESIPSISSGVVGSRFVSQTDIESARERREEQWKAAYARLGQEPPPVPQEDAYDGRSLAEKLAANKAAKQEEWEEKTKLANQFRALEEDEIMFLDSVREAQELEERKRKERDGEEVKGFREAIAARVIVKSPPADSGPSSTDVKPTAKPTAPPKKDSKKSMKGIIVKKKPKPAGESKPSVGTAVSSAKTVSDDAKASKDGEPGAKRRKVTS